MAEELRLAYLGGMQMSRGGTPLSGFVSVKAPALVCYLALTGRPCFRLVLAGLLWGDFPEEDACANLRKVLSNLRALIGSNLITTPQTVTFDRQSSYWLDVEAFLDRADKETRRQGNKETEKQGDKEITEQELPLSTSSVSTYLPELRAAADLYRGDFLDGFYVRHAPAFEEWVLGQRERLRREAARVFQVLAGYYAGRGEHNPALAYTSRQLALDPWREEAHRQMMALLFRSGQRSAALAQYEQCRRLLAQELDIEPTAETIALYRRIRASGAPRPHNLPTPATSFVGREAELAQTAHRLADPNCRLLTILGPGGVGKTRLALQAALDANGQPNDAFLDGIFFVPLHTIHSTQALTLALAGSMGLLSLPGADPLAELLRHLRAKELLLVLDGFEHLVGEAGLLSAIVKHAPQVKLLITSRQRLNLSGEWRLELAGLPYAPLGTREGIETYSAAQLFLQRARQACPDIEPSQKDLQAITYICELVEGLPLAIELAAAWARALCCLDIARAVEGGLDALTAFLPDQPARRQSIRAAFEHSWTLLTSAERRAFRRIAVFRGGFDKEAAERVTGADLALLTALTDKSLLRRRLPGRYELHELLWQFAGEKLSETPGECDDAFTRHAHHYLGEFMPQRERELRGGRQQEALDRFREEIGNVQAAWSWATTHGMDDEIGRSLLSLSVLFEMLGWWQEGQAAFCAAADRLRIIPQPEDEVSGEARVVIGTRLASQGSSCVHTSDFDAALTRFQESLELLRLTSDGRKQTALPYLGLGLLANTKGRMVDAEDHFRHGLAILRVAGDTLLTAFTLDYLGEICAARGKPDEARQWLREALDLHRKNGEQCGIGRALYGLGRVAARLGEHAEARQRLGESLDVFVALGARVAAARVKIALGEVAYEEGEYASASQLLEESLPVLEETQNTVMVVRCLIALGRVVCALRQYEQADVYFRSALGLAGELGADASAQDARAGLADLQARTWAEERVTDSAPVPDPICE